MVHDEDHWRELIETMIERMGAEQFIGVSIAVLYRLGYKELINPIVIDHINLLDKLAETLKGTK